MELEDLIASVDILEYISQYTEFEEKNGEFWSLSPLKEEETPSFSVRREENVFYDFSSGCGGNVLSFIKAYNKCSGREAVEKLKEYVGGNGIVLPQVRLAATKVAKTFSKRPKHCKESKSSTFPDNYMDRYEKNDEKLAIWSAEGITDEAMEHFQVRYDSFSDRIVYPIRDVHGKIINVSGRTVDPDWKAKKLRKYTYFAPLGTLDTIYGLSENYEEIRKKHEIILFEGAKSVLIAYDWGFRNTGAVLTSHLNSWQVKILAELGCDVVFALDKGIDVREDENIKKLRRYVKVSYVFDRNDLLKDKDSPVDEGRETWEKLYKERVMWTKR